MSGKRWVALLLALGCAFAAGRGCADVRRPAEDDGRLPPGRGGRPSSAAPRAGAGTQATPLPPPQVETAGTVVRIRDGDSIVVKRDGIGVEVRLDGIDAPELVQAFGKKARGFTSGLAFGKSVRLAGKGKDRYDRELAEVFLPDGRSLNRELVAAGYAWWYRKYSTDGTLASLEQEARTERRGLWADENPVPPWDFREAERK